MELIADVSPVRQFLAYLSSIGIDERDLPIARLDDNIRQSSEPLRISARIIIELMEAAAEESGTPDLGLKFVEWLDPKGLGALSLTSEHCASPEEWYRLACRYIHLSNNAVLYDLNVDDEVTLIQDVLPILRPRANQFLDALLALTVRSLRSMLGTTWKPSRVELRSRPVERSAYWRFFRCDIEFNAERHAIVMTRNDFERRHSQGDRSMLTFIEGHLERRALNWSAEIEDQVFELVSLELAGGTPTLAHVASLLYTTPRTLQRRLGERGTDFRGILKSVRIQTANQHFTRYRRPQLQKLAYELGFSEPSAVSRFIRTEMGQTARALVQEQERKGDMSMSNSKSKTQAAAPSDNTP